jgi:glycosyltransferase involved in cell wall biosynthesis
LTKILATHNDYGRPSGEEHALAVLAALAQRRGCAVTWMRRSSVEINYSFVGNAKAFLCGVANPWMARRMGRLLDADRPDVVLVQNIYPLLSPSILVPCKKRKIPVIMRCPNYRLFCPSGLHLSKDQVCERCLDGREYWCILRNCEGDLFKSSGYALRNAVARISRRILDSIDIFIVLSEFQKRRFINQGISEERLAILPNIAPNVESEGVFSFATEKERFPTEAPGNLVGFVGRISPEKGIEDLIAAARALPDIPFAVAGSTERMPELVAQSPKNVQWEGFLQGKQLDDFYRRCRIVVFPSRWFEGFPNVATHAMMMRKPVIASRIGALPEIVEDEKTGLLFEVGNVENLAGKILTLYRDPERCRVLGNAGRLKAEREYGPEVVYERLMGIFEKAIRLSSSSKRMSAIG